MFKLSALILLAFLLPTLALGEVKDFGVNEQFKVVGTLSSDLKELPKLSTFSPRGIPVHILIKAKGRIGLALVGFKGQKVNAIVLITKVINIRNYEGDLIEVSSAAATTTDF